MGAQTLVRKGCLNIQLPLGATANTYTTAYTVGTPQKIPNAVLDKGCISILESLCLIDTASQSRATDLYFFNQLPTTQGADNAAFALSAAEALYLIGRVSVLSSSYSSGSSHMTEATIANIRLGLSGLVPSGQGVANLSSASRDVYVVAVTRSTPTYTAGCLTLSLMISQL